MSTLHTSPSLTKAVKEDNLESFVDAVVSHMAHEADLVDEDGHHLPLISYAAKNGAVKCVNFLLESGVGIYARDERGRFPIHYAAMAGSIEIIEDMCNYGASIVQPDRDGMYPIHYAAERGHLKLIKWLWVKGINLSETAAGYTSQTLKTPLHLACSNQHRDCAEFLVSNVDKQTQKDREGNSPLHYAAETGDLTIFDMLVDNGYDPLEKNIFGVLFSFIKLP